MQMNSEIGCCGIPGVPPASFFKALCDSNRMAILVGLAEVEQTQTVTEIASRHPIDMSVVSRHLRALRDAGIVRSEKRGKEVHYALNALSLAKLLRDFASMLESCPCCRAEEGCAEC